jgi:signal peptidase I
MTEITENLLFIETKGFSMWPFLKTGERIVVKRIPLEDLRIGDIILYRSDNQMVCHRLIKKVDCEDGYLLYTRGDTSPNLGEPITEKALVGKVTGILRKGRFINFTGRWCHFVNRLIVEFAPFLRIGIKVGKGPIIYVRSLVRRWRSR